MHNLDLYSLSFWAFAGVAAFIMAPLADAKLRERTFACLNIAFLALCLGHYAIYAAADLFLAHLVLKAIPASKGRSGGWIWGAAGALILALFIIHKLSVSSAEPSLGASAAASALSDLRRVLSVIGFSYVALRFADVSLAVREGRHAPPGLAATINYLVPFHMLAAGPIQAYDEFVHQPRPPKPQGFTGSLAGLDRIAQGLFKKYVLAAILENLFRSHFRAGSPYFFIELQVNYVWLYLDFSAYSDIAVGLGKLLGFPAPENFNAPYVARNMIDYWERWHISLSQFIRRNIFIPVQMILLRLSDGRRPLVCASLAFLVSFLLCGLWHEIGLRWLLWGAYHAAGLIACNLYRALLLRRFGRKGLAAYMANPLYKAIAVFVTFEYVACSLIIITVDLAEPFRWLEIHY